MLGDGSGDDEGNGEGGGAGGGVVVALTDLRRWCWRY